MVVTSMVALTGSVQAHPNGCTGADGVASACTPCDFTEWHVHILEDSKGLGVRCW